MWAGYPVPLQKNPMFLHEARGKAGCPVACPYYEGEMDYAAVCTPNAERLCAEMCWLSQTCLLADEEAMRDVARAAGKVWSTGRSWRGRSEGVGEPHPALRATLSLREREVVIACPAAFRHAMGSGGRAWRVWGGSRPTPGHRGRRKRRPYGRISA